MTCRRGRGRKEGGCSQHAAQQPRTRFMLFKWQFKSRNGDCTAYLGPKCAYEEAYRLCVHRGLYEGTLYAYEPTFGVLLHKDLPGPKRIHIRKRRIECALLYFETRNRWGRVVTRVQARPSQDCDLSDICIVVRGQTGSRRMHYQPLPQVRGEDATCVT